MLPPQHYVSFVFQNKNTVTKLSMKSLSAKICRKKVRHHEAKLVSIFPTNFLSREANSSPAFSAFWGRFFFKREIGSIISVMFKIRIERNKAGKVIDIKLYNVTLNILIRTLGKS